MVRVSECLRKTISEDGAIVLDVKQGLMFGLNVLGSRIVELLEQRHTPEQIVEEIASTYGIAKAVANCDVREFLETLERLRLIESEAPGIAA